MTKREAKIIALGYIIGIADVSFDHDSTIQDLPEKHRVKVGKAMDEILSGLGSRSYRLEAKSSRQSSGIKDCARSLS